MLLRLTPRRSPRRAHYRRRGFRGRRNFCTTRCATAGRAACRRRSSRGHLRATCRPGSRGWCSRLLGTPCGTTGRRWRQRCVGHVAVRERIVKGHRCRRFWWLARGLLTLGRLLCRRRSHCGTDRGTLLTRFVPHANDHPTTKGRQARHDGKADRQADMQLAQNQPACVSLPYAVC